MRFNKVLLVNLYYKESGYGERLIFPPVGLGYISQYLEQENIIHEVIDTGTGCGNEDVIKKIRGMEPDLIAISLNSICFPKSFELIRRIKEIFPLIAVVVGGPHVSSEQDAILKENGVIDFAIIKEGEIPLALLCKGEPLDRIPGLIWRDKDGKVNSNPIKSAEINDLPYPRYERFDMFKKYTPGIMAIVTSRGCPFKCAFCQQSSLLGKMWRGRESQSIVEEIEFWYRRGFSSIHILDDNFGMDKKRLLFISDLVAKMRLKDLEIFLIGGLRIQNMTQEILLALKKMGVRNISFGVESGSDRILKFIGKGITVKDIDKVVKMAVEMGFLVRLFFIIGFPYEKMEDAKKSFDLALRHKVHAVRFFNLVPYEGTGIMKWIKENDAKLLYSYEEYMSNFKYYQRIPIFDTKEGMSLEEKKEALYMADEIARQIDGRQ